jgi:hypothetical protein
MFASSIVLFSSVEVCYPRKKPTERANENQRPPYLRIRDPERIHWKGKQDCVLIAEFRRRRDSLEQSPDRGEARQTLD